MTTGAGQTVRVAQGVVRINVAPLASDARQAIGHFQSISDAGKQIGTGVKAGTQVAQSSLRDLTSAAQGAMGQLARLFALPTLIGVSQNVKQIDFTIRALAGSEEKANDQLERMNKLADRTGQSVLSIQKAALGILPAINRANVDLEQTLLLTQRMAILDPFQGTEGAALAIRELLAGQVQSAAMRFELPRAELNRIVDSAGGDPQKIIDGLDQLIAKMGVTEDTVVAAGEAGIHTFTRFKDELILTTAQGFEPMLNNFLIPIVDEFGNLMESARDANGELVEVAVTLGGILATVTALQAVGLGGKFTTGLGVAAGALYAGSEIGTAAARFGAESGLINNSRLENVSQDEAKQVLEETAKQLAVVLADLMIEGGFVFVEGIMLLKNAFDRAKITVEMLKTGLEMAVEVIRNGFDNAGIVLENAGDHLANIIEFIGLKLREIVDSVLVAIGGLIASVPGLEEEGLGLQNAGNQGRAARQGRARALDREIENSDLLAGTTSIADALAPFADEINAFLKLLDETPLGLTDEQKADLEATKEEVKKKILIPFAEVLNLIEEAASTTFKELRDRVANAGGGGVAPAEEFTTEMLEAFGKFQKDLAELDKKAADDRKKTNEAATNQQSDALKKRNSQLANLDSEGTKRREEITRSANEAAEDAAEDHQETLAEIQRRGMREAQRAAARFDAQGVFNALENQSESERVENQSFDKQKSRREEQTAREIEDLTVANEQKRLAIQDGYRTELQDIEAQRLQKLAQIEAELRDERAAKNQAFAELHNRLAAEAQAQGNHGVRMLNIQGQGLAAQEAAYRAWITRMGGYVLPPPQTAMQQQFSQAAQNVNTAVNKIRLPGFASGIGNIPSTMMAWVHEGEGIMNETTAALMRSMTGSTNPSQAQMQGAIAGGGGKQLSVSGNTFMLGDIGKYSETEVEGMVARGISKWFEEFAD